MKCQYVNSNNSFLPSQTAPVDHMLPGTLTPQHKPVNAEREAEFSSSLATAFTTTENANPQNPMDQEPLESTTAEPSSTRDSNQTLQRAESKENLKSRKRGGKKK